MPMSKDIIILMKLKEYLLCAKENKKRLYLTISSLLGQSVAISTTTHACAVNSFLLKECLCFTLLK